MSCESQRLIWREYRQYTEDCPKTSYDQNQNTLYVRNVVLYLVGNRLDLLAFQGSNCLYPQIGVRSANGNEVRTRNLVGSVDDVVAVVNVASLSRLIEVGAIFVELFSDLMK